MAYNPRLGPDADGRSHSPLPLFIWSQDALAADGLRAALASEPRLACVVQLSAAQVLLWDLGVLGAARSEAAGATLEFAREHAQTIVALVPDELAVDVALAAGARVVLQRRAASAALVAAIFAARLGLFVLDARVAQARLAQRIETVTVNGTESVAADTLTQREREVLDLLALGLTNKAIAERLEVSVHTVKFHVNSILAKLGADSRTAAVATALRRGLIAT